MKKSSIADRYLQTLESNSVENAPKSPPKSIHGSPTRSPTRALPTPTKTTAQGSPGRTAPADASARSSSPLKPMSANASPSRYRSTLDASNSAKTPTLPSSKFPAMQLSKQQPPQSPKQESPAKQSTTMPKSSLSPARIATNSTKAVSTSPTVAKIGPKPDRNPLMHNQDLSPSEISWDKERKNWQAYEYLCHVAEAKEWIEKILGTEQPPVDKFPESLQNGIALAKITQQIRPELIKWPIFEHKRLQYRHTENITMFFDLLEALHVPSLFQFDMTDLYEKRNLPKVIYCIHAISHYVAEADTAVAAVDDLLGKLKFSDDQLDTTQRGINGKAMPNFGAMTRQLSGQHPKLDIEPEPESESEPEPEAEPEPEPEPEAELEETHPKDQLQYKSRAKKTEGRSRADPEISETLTDSEDEIINVKPPRRNRATPKKSYRPREYSYGDDYRDASDSYSRGYDYRYDYAPRSRRNLDSRDYSGYKYDEWTSRHRDRYTPRTFSTDSVRSRVLGTAEVMLMRLEELEPEIADLQAVCRGFLIRKYHKKEMANDSVVALQAVSRRALVRGRIMNLRNQPRLTELQAAARGLIARRRLGGTRTLSQKWVIDLQAAVRGSLARRNHMRSRPVLSAVETDAVIALQAVARGAHVRKYFSATAMQARQIITVQSLARGTLCRRNIAMQRKQLETREARKSVTALQSAFRGVVLRFRLGCVYDDLDQHIVGIVGLQTRARGTLQKRRFETIRAQWFANVDKIVMLQSIWRAKMQGSRYRTLIAVENPSLNAIKPFVHLIDDNEVDYKQELELEEWGKRIGIKVKENEHLEGRIAQLDTKIALLVKNNISIDELVLQQQRQNQNLRQQLQKEKQLNHELHGSGSSSSGRRQTVIGDQLKDQFNPKSLQKASRDRVELYQGLLYVLQTQPEYTSKLMNHKAPRSLDMAHLILSVYGNAEAPREQFFLLKLLGRAATQSAVGSAENTVAWKIVSHLNKRPGSVAAAKKFLTATARKLSASADQLLEYDPHLIYQQLTGGADMSSEEAIQEPSVRAIFVQNLQRLRDATASAVHSLISDFDSLPFHIKFLAREVYRQVLSVTGQKPMALAAIGQVVISQFLQPALLSADSLELLDAAIGHTAKNIILVSRVLHQIGLMKPFDTTGSTDVYLQPLNEFVKSTTLQLSMKFQDTIVGSPDLHSFFHMSEFDDITMHERPALEIGTNNVLALHAMCYQHLADLTSSTDSMLRPVVEQLGPLPKDAREMFDLARFDTIRLELNPRFGSAKLANSSSNSSLMATTKRCLGYVLRVQSNADDLMAVLVAPVELEDEHMYNILLDTDNTREVAGELANLTFRELKLLTLEKVLELESAGLVTRQDAYQTLVNVIAEDIRNKDQVRQQRTSILTARKRTLHGLEEKGKFLQERLETYSKHIEQAMTALQTETHLANQAKAKRFQRFQLPQTKGSNTSDASGPRFGQYKASAEKLYERRVIVSLRGYTDRQLRDVSLTFSCYKVAEFQLDVTYKGVLVPSGSSKITLDDLLDHQYQGTVTYDVINDSLKFNTTRLLQLVFVKFFGAPQGANK